MNPNFASLQELKCIPGVGEVKATKILQQRTIKPFETLKEFLDFINIEQSDNFISSITLFPFEPDTLEEQHNEEPPMENKKSTEQTNDDIMEEIEEQKGQKRKIDEVEVESKTDIKGKGHVVEKRDVMSQEIKRRKKK